MLGTLLGVTLLVVLSNSLLLIGLPSVWHKVATGLIIIVSTGITARQRNPKAPVRQRRMNLNNANLLRLGGITLAVLVTMTWLTGGRFLSVANFESMAFMLPELALLSLAMMLAMLTGGIDLSVVAIANLSGIVATLTMTHLLADDVRANGDCSGRRRRRVVGDRYRRNLWQHQWVAYFSIQNFSDTDDPRDDAIIYWRSPGHY